MSQLTIKKSLLVIALALSSTLSFASPQSEKATATYLSGALHDSQKLHAFLQDMPKGGDLHNHTSGSTFAENMLKYAANDHLCINRGSFKAYNGKCSAENDLMTAIKDPDFKDAVIDAWSMQHFKKGDESGHDHFFSTFGKFGIIPHLHQGEVVAEIAERAAEQNEIYVETMLTIESKEAANLGKKLGWNNDFAIMRKKLLAADFDKIVANMSAHIDKIEAKKNDVLACGTANAKPGCHVVIRYQQQIARLMPKEMVFAQMLAGFEAAAGKDKRIVTLNLVQPEDAPVSMRDYKLHMQMLGYLHTVYPTVKITTHAGELNHVVASDDGLKFHINDAVYVGHANRIGHGVDIESEADYTKLLSDMAKNDVMVEINLSSNKDILNVSGKNHPLPLYMQYGVPVAFSTDDEGVTRDILTTEYQMAESTYQFDYKTLKNLVRNSLSHAFISGDDLWLNHEYKQVVPACNKDELGAKTISQRCQNFLADSEKAQLEWQLESKFNQFEARFNN